jgi:hypothetical protein
VSAVVPRVGTTMSSPLDCVEATNLVTEAMEGALLGSQLARFEEHLAHCESCALFLRQMRAVVAVLKALRPPPPSIDERVLESFRRRYSR